MEPSGETSAPLTSGSRRWAFVAVLAAFLALHVSLAWLGTMPEPRTMKGDELIYWPEAQKLAVGEEAEAYSPLWPRGYLWFLAAVVHVFGVSSLAVELIQTCMLLVVAWLVRDLTRSWTGSWLAGDVAGTLTAVFPPLAAFAHYVWPEILHLFFFVGGLWLLSRGGTRVRWQFAAGVCLGLAVATKSLLLPFLPLLLWADRPAARWRALRRAALVLLGIGAVLVPSSLATPGPSTAVSSATFNLWVGLVDRSRIEGVDSVVMAENQAYLESAATAAGRDAILRAKIGDRVRSDGVATVIGRQLSTQYFRLLDRNSFLATMLRGKSVHPEAAGYVDPPSWLVRTLMGSSYVLYGVLLVTATWGIVLAAPKRGSWLFVATCFLAYNVVLFLFLHVKTRYRVQFLPVLFIYAGWTVAWLWARLSVRLSARSDVDGYVAPEARWSRWRAGVATLASALLLFLAFGGEVADAAFRKGQVLRPPEVVPSDGPLWAEPNPIAVCDRSGLGITTLHWRVDGLAGLFEVRVDAPDGALFARGGARGSAATKTWVRDGMSFHLVALTSGEVLGSLVVRVDRSSCGKTGDET